MFQNVKKSLETSSTNRNEVHDVSRRRINSGNACHSFWKFKILSTYQNAEDQDIQNDVSFFPYVWKVVSYFDGRIYIADLWKQD